MHPLDNCFVAVLFFCPLGRLKSRLVKKSVQNIFFPWTIILMDWPKNNLLQNCSEGVWPPLWSGRKTTVMAAVCIFFLVLRFLKQRLDRFAQFSVLKCHLSILPIGNRQHLCSKDHLMWDQDTSKTRWTETTTSPRPRQNMLRPSPSKTETEC